MRTLGITGDRWLVQRDRPVRASMSPKLCPAAQVLQVWLMAKVTRF